MQTYQIKPERPVLKKICRDASEFTAERSEEHSDIHQST